MGASSPCTINPSVCWWFSVLSGMPVSLQLPSLVGNMHPVEALTPNRGGVTVTLQTWAYAPCQSPE